MKNDKYVIVTAIQTFRQRYAIPVSELQKLNPHIDISNNIPKQVEWANDTVTMEEVKEFSQLHIGEQIIDTKVVHEEEMLNQFNNDNDYLKSWTDEDKIKYVNDWQEKFK